MYKLKIFVSYCLLSIFLSVSNNCLGSFKFQPLEEQDNFPQSYSQSKSKLTTEIIKDWIKQNNILSNINLESLKIEPAEIKEAGFTKDLFFIEATTFDHHINKYALKVYASNGSDNKSSLSCLRLSKSNILDSFKDDPLLPILSIDIWTGYYIDESNVKNYLSLMPKASGMLLSEYLMVNADNKSKILEASKRVVEAYGRAHALHLDEKTMKDNKWGSWYSKFAHGDSKPGNIFIQEREGKPSTITLIDLEGAANNWNKESFYGNQFYSYAFINDFDGLMMTHLTKANSIFLKTTNLDEEKIKIESIFKSYTQFFMPSQISLIREHILNQIKSRAVIAECNKSMLAGRIREDQEVQDFIANLNL